MQKIQKCEIKPNVVIVMKYSEQKPKWKVIFKAPMKKWTLTVTSVAKCLSLNGE